MTEGLSIRVGTDRDSELVGRCVYLALAWNPEEQIPDIETVLAHPEVLRYHTDWGRRGDTLVIAEAASGPIGYAFARLFSSDDHGHGFVDESIPEMGVAVESGSRGRGIGSKLLETLHRELHELGFPAVSLSVANANPARRLYERLGYVEHASDDGGAVLVKQL